MYLIGLTGNIACGKSTVVAMLQTLGAQVCDADAVVHAVQAPAGPAYQPIVDAFGTIILQHQRPGAPIDRAALGRIVFGDPQQLRRLESIVHPLVREEIQLWLTEHINKQVDVAVIDAIKLLESGWKSLCHAVWVVTATPAQQLQRLVEQRGMSEADARQRIAAQPAQAAKVAQADVVIDNSAALAHTFAQVQAAWNALHATQSSQGEFDDRT